MVASKDQRNKDGPPWPLCEVPSFLGPLFRIVPGLGVQNKLLALFSSGRFEQCLKLSLGGLTLWGHRIVWVTCWAMSGVKAACQ